MTSEKVNESCKTVSNEADQSNVGPSPSSDLVSPDQFHLLPTADENPSGLRLNDDEWLEIIQYLSWRQIFRLRQVNKRLFRITHTKSIWANLLNRIRMSIVVPEDLSGDFTPEQTVVRCLKLQQGWAGCTSVVPRVRLLESKDPGKYSVATGTVVGDRPWVVTLSSSGAFHLWDLAERKPFPVHLGTYTHLNLRIFNCNLYSYLPSKTNLVTLVVMTDQLGQGRLEFFQLSLDQQTLTDLGALPLRCCVGALKIYTNTLLYRTDLPDPGRYIEMLDWKDALKEPDFRFWCSTPICSRWILGIELLTEPSAIIAHDGDTLYIYDSPMFYTTMTVGDLNRSDGRRSRRPPSRTISLREMASPIPGSSLITTYFVYAEYFQLFWTVHGGFSAVSKKPNGCSHVKAATSGLHRGVLLTINRESRTEAYSTLHLVTISGVFEEEPQTVNSDLRYHTIKLSPYSLGLQPQKIALSEATGTVCLFGNGNVLAIDLDI